MAPDDEQASTEYPQGQEQEKSSDDNASYSSADDVEVALAPSGDDGEKQVHTREEVKFYRYTLASNIWFLIASILYVWLAVITFQYYDMLNAVPSWVLAADDDYSWIGYWDDDYVFQAGSQWVSRYTIVYFVAAMGFVITGLIDFIKWPSILAFIFILAGGFGVASAICTDVNPRLSNIFNSVSVHMFMIEAIGLLFRRSFFGGVELWLRLSDSFFLIGSLMDVAISYTAIFNVFNMTLAVLGIVAACLWVLTALIYIGTTYYIHNHDGGFEGALHGGKGSENTQVDGDSDEQENVDSDEQEMATSDKQAMTASDAF